MEWQYQQAPAYDRYSHQVFESVDEKTALGFDPEGTNHAGPTEAPLHSQVAAYEYQSFGANDFNDYHTYRTTAYNDTSIPNFSTQYPRASHAPLTFNPLYQPIPYTPAFAPTSYALPTENQSAEWAVSSQISTSYPPESPTQSLHLGDRLHLQSPSTISPTAIGGSQAGPSRSFGDIMTGSGASSSSISSSDGGASVFDTWSMSARALGLSPRRANPPPTIPESTLAPSPLLTQSPTISPPAPSKRHSLMDAPLQGIDHALSRYVNSENRLAFGERKIIVMSPKVGQKSYGSEKRFLCPHPQAVLIGAAWWHASADGTIRPPRVNISLSGEHPIRDAVCAWTSLDGWDLSTPNAPARTQADQPFWGAVPGKNVFISEKLRDVTALVTVTAPASDNFMNGRMASPEVIGTFESKEITVISKPSKKRSLNRSTDLLIHHGSTVALFNRTKAQAASTRFLSVVPDFSRVYGSDKKPMPEAAPPILPPQSRFFPGMATDPAIWESFIIWVVNPDVPSGPGTAPPLHSGWPSAPANAVAPGSRGPQSPTLRYNSTVVLQSLQTGYSSPTLVLRRTETDGDAIGMDGVFSDFETCTPDGELSGDLVSQLHKVAFEVYHPAPQHAQAIPGSFWLSCGQDIATEKYVTTVKRWTPLSGPKSRPGSAPTTPASRYGILPMTPHTTAAPLPSTPVSPHSSSSSDYFGAYSRNSSSSALFSSPCGEEFPLPADGGPVRRPRTSSTGRAGTGPLARPNGHRSRRSADSSQSNSFERLPSSATHQVSTERKSWALQVGDACIWSIISTEQNTYTFYIPPDVTNVKDPVAPYPIVSHIVAPELRSNSPLIPGYPATPSIPLVTLRGRGFELQPSLKPRHLVFYGEEQAGYSALKSETEMVALQPEAGERAKEIFLVRDDGHLIVPPGLWYS